MSAALELAEAGFDVAVLEAGRIGSGGSGRNGGHVCQGWPTDFDKISGQLSPEAADIAWESGMAAVDLLRSRVKNHKIDCDLTFGYLHAALHKRQMDELDAMQDEWELRGYDQFTRLGTQQELNEHIGSTLMSGRCTTLGAASTATEYLHGLAAAAFRAGAHIFENSAVKRLERGSGRKIPLASGGQITARNNAMWQRLSCRYWLATDENQTGTSHIIHSGNQTPVTEYDP